MIIAIIIFIVFIAIIFVFILGAAKVDEYGNSIESARKKRKRKMNMLKFGRRLTFTHQKKSKRVANK